MPDTKSPISPELIIELALKHRWFIIVPFCISMIAGIYLAITLPKVYMAETTILIQPQRVPSEFVRSLIPRDLTERISTLSQQILSRTNLEAIINQFSLFSGPQYAKMYPEDKIENLRKRISVNVSKAGRGAPSAFSVSFKGKPPERVMKIANTLTSYFINENLKARESQAMGTSRFLDEELNEMRKQLEQVEETLRQYRMKYMGKLPEQLETNLRMLDRLQEQLSEREQNFRDAKNRLIAIDNRMSLAQNMRAPPSPQTENGLPSLEQLKEQFADMKTRYTERHPDVIRLKKTIANLEAQIEGQKIELPGDTQVSELSADRTGLDAATLNQRNEIIREIKMYGEEISNLHAQLKTYQEHVENTPKREQELLSLNRDYNNIQESYNSLLSRKLEADIAVNMEKKQKGEQFRVLDSAKLPEKPISPNMKKIFMLSLAVGLGIGGGFLFLFYYLDSSFRKPEEIESLLGVPVLITLPTLYHPKDIKKQRIHTALSIFSIMISFVLLAGFAVLTIKGVDQTMKLVQKLINI